MNLGGWAGPAYCPSMAEDTRGAGECAEGDVRTTESSKAAGKQGQEMSPKRPAEQDLGTKSQRSSQPERLKGRWSVLIPEVAAVSSQHTPQGGPMAPKTRVATKCLAGAYMDEKTWSFTLESKSTYFSPNQLHGECRANEDVPIL